MINKSVKKIFLGVIFLFSMCSFTESENPFDEEKISLGFSALSLPKIYTNEKDVFAHKEDFTWGTSFVLDVPIYRYLHSGFMVRYFLSPHVGDIGGIVDLSGILKPMIGFSTGLGHLSFYILASCGLSVTFMPIIDKKFAISQEELESQSPIRKHVNVFGGLVNASAQLGVEYYPFKQFGLFAEGGFAYWYFLHQIDEKLFQPTFEMFSYHLTGVIAHAGIKFIF